MGSPTYLKGPTIINAHPNKKRRVKVLVINYSFNLLLIHLSFLSTKSSMDSLPLGEERREINRVKIKMFFLENFYPIYHSIQILFKNGEGTQILLFKKSLNFGVIFSESFYDMLQSS